MCGILGFFDPGGVNDVEALALAQRMGERIQHRGPDDHGEWCDRDAGIVLGQRRLSINDLSPAGHQPMLSASGRYAIVLNGEIYNFHDLRVEFEANGYPFRGHSDTEVALAAFEAFGVDDAWSRFVGMYAIALWDREERTLYLARDRVGEKPLYYARLGRTFVFASDLNSMREMPAFAPRIDNESIGLMMQHFYIPEPRTIYENVRKLMPGTVLRIDANAYDIDIEPQEYWSPVETALDGARNRVAQSPDDAIDGLDALLRETIRDKMISDVPLGAFLSGGIDSSTVVALMQAESSTRIKTFSIGFTEDEYNEAKEAKRVAEHLGTDHTELYVSPEETLAVIPKLPSLYSEPFADSSQIPTFLVSQLARQEVTVALSGDGGDELFGGYTRYLLAEQLWEKYQGLPLGLQRVARFLLSRVPPERVDQMMRVIRPVLPAQLRYKQYGNKVQKLAAVLGSEDPLSVYRSLISMWHRPSQVVIGASDIDLLGTLSPKIGELSTFTERMMLIDLMTYLPGDILTKVDRASMGVSLEVRVPFLDHRVIEHAWRVPFDYKVREGSGKWLLRQVLYRYVPREIIDRPKMGFGVPVDTWLRGPLREWAGDLLQPSTLSRDGFFHPDMVATTWEQHLTGKVDAAPLLWPLLMFQAWFNHYERSAA